MLEQVRKTTHVAGQVAKVTLVLALTSKLIACAPIQSETPLNSPPAMTETIQMPTETVIPTATLEPTPSIAEPSVPNGLSAENAATQTLENGVWVVKNKNGETTATWNEQTKEWTYNMEAITVIQSVVGYKEDHPAIYELLQRPLPPDDPAFCFVDPETHEPLGYGTWRSGTEDRMDANNNKIQLPFTYVSVRLRGAVDIDDDYQVILFSVPTGIDREAVLAYPVPKYDDEYRISYISNDGLGVPVENYDIDKIKVSENYDLFNTDLFGRQVILAFYPNRPLNYFKFRSEDEVRALNTETASLIAFLNGATEKPDILVEPGYYMRHGGDLMFILRTDGN